MGALSSLVPQAQPALIGGGCEGSGTEGATWRVEFQWLDEDGTPSAVDFTGTTGTCVIYTAVGGTLVATLTFTGAAAGVFTLNLAAASTTGLAAGATDEPRACVWSLAIDDGTDIVQAWTPLNSPFYVYPEV
jgi:hypothetical protein